MNQEVDPKALELPSAVLGEEPPEECCCCPEAPEPYVGAAPPPPPLAVPPAPKVWSPRRLTLTNGMIGALAATMATPAYRAKLTRMVAAPADRAFEKRVEKRRRQKKLAKKQRR